jgi:hypothetical protein
MKPYYHFRTGLHIKDNGVMCTLEVADNFVVSSVMLTLKNSTRCSTTHEYSLSPSISGRSRFDSALSVRVIVVSR